MRSSTARALSKINNELADSQTEVEPLLAEYSSDDDAADFEVVIDGPEDQAEIPPKQYPPRRAETLRRMREQVDSLQPGADAKVKRRVTKQYIYTILVFTTLSTLFLSPSVGLYYLYNLILKTWMDNDVTDAALIDHEQMEAYQRQYAAKLTELNSHQTERDGILMPYYKRWWQYDAEGTNCNTVHDPHPEMGRAELQDIISGKEHPANFFFHNRLGLSSSKRCLDIIREGVEVEKQQSKLLWEIHDDNYDLDVLESHIKTFAGTVAYDDSSVAEIFRMGVVVSSVVIGIIGAVILLGGCWAGRVAYHGARGSWARLDDEKNHLRSIGDNVPDALLEELGKLPVPLILQANQLLGDLSQELQEKIDAAEERARQRAAFLSGKNHKDSGLFRFLNTSGSREATQVIFEHVGLLPRP